MNLFGSKKFIAAFAGFLVAIGSAMGIEISTESMTAILSPIVAYIVGQGIADHGKEKAKIEKSLQS